MKHYFLDCTMLDRGESISICKRSQNLRHVTWARSDVKDWRCDTQNIVNLSGVNRSNEWISHHDHMNIRCRKRPAQFIQRLIGKANNVW
jgi:hypothetical protein